MYKARMISLHSFPKWYVIASCGAFQNTCISHDHNYGYYFFLNLGKYLNAVSVVNNQFTSKIRDFTALC